MILDFNNDYNSLKINESNANSDLIPDTFDIKDHRYSDESGSLECSLPIIESFDKCEFHVEHDLNQKAYIITFKEPKRGPILQVNAFGGDNVIEALDNFCNLKITHEMHILENYLRESGIDAFRQDNLREKLKRFEKNYISD